MTDWLGFILQIAGFTLAAAGFVWLLGRTFAVSQSWGTVLFFLPLLAPVYALATPRRSGLPLLLMLLGAGIVASPVGIRHFQRRFVDLGERVRTVDGELHVTLTGWDKEDYAVLDQMSDAVVLQMANADVTDATLKRLAGMKNLRELDLNDTAVTDAGLEHLQLLTKLQQLRLRGTKITDEGFRAGVFPLELLHRVEVTGTSVKGSTLREWKNAKTGREYLH